MSTKRVYNKFMKKIILLVLSLIFLTGCGIFDLNNFIIPDDLEFIAVVESLNTPEKICEYMKEDFTYQKYAFYAPSPYRLWLTKNGDCNDFATFGVFVANYHNYETYQIQIFWKDVIYRHWIAVYAEDEGLSFSDSQCYSFCFSKTYFKTFDEIVKFDCEYHTDHKIKKYKVYDYDMNIIETGYNN